MISSPKQNNNGKLHVVELVTVSPLHVRIDQVSSLKRAMVAAQDIRSEGKDVWIESTGVEFSAVNKR
jgi:hypothetical protein